MSKSSRDKKRKIARIRKRDGDNCWLCKQYCSEQDQTMDHVIPKSKGGKNSIDNLKLAHFLCNVARGNSGYSPDVFNTTISTQVADYIKEIPLDNMPFKFKPRVPE